jgi:hypothetical protein
MVLLRRPGVGSVMDDIKGREEFIDIEVYGSSVDIAYTANGIPNPPIYG